MIVHKNIQNLPAFTNAVITIGTFDGVHTGHRQIIELMKTEAAKIGGETVIITFDPHPRHVISSGKHTVHLINTLDEKLRLLENYGIDHIVIVPFTEIFANQTPEEYIEDFLVKTFYPHTIIIGYDHKFGKGRKGDYTLLEAKAEQFNYTVKEIPVHILQDITISSTKIRESLLKGDMETANACLGYHYFFSGTVVEGNKLGRTIGYPTANLQIEDEHKLVPGNGVYAVYVHTKNNVQFKGMMNIGVRPTVDGSKKVIEVNIFDFNEDIYGQQLAITVVKHSRDEVKFSGLDALKTQLAKDKQDTLSYLEI